MIFLSNPFNDPIYWSSRTTYLQKTETRVVTNGMIALSEVPSETDGLTISGYTEIYTNNITTSTQYYVDYTTGFVYFHSSRERTQLSITYMGTGAYLFPASRTYLLDSDENWTSTDLETLSTEIKLYISNIISDLTDHVNSVYAHDHDSVVFSTGLKRDFIVTTAFAANEVITLSTGRGAISGRSTASGSTVTLNDTSSAMNSDNLCKIYYNNIQVGKGAGTGFRAVWNSTTTFYFNFTLDKGDTFTVERLIN